jgi:hypothetical protein
MIGHWVLGVDSVGPVYKESFVLLPFLVIPCFLSQNRAVQADSVFFLILWMLKSARQYMFCVDWLQERIKDI